ncbi:MAG TPA: O-antigen ligase family protein [Candidatus Dormibacteraeota bacterium]|nr:O-antigen ligase family protein [Candidatus Dormibacteraeota bacterium]
MRPLLERLGGFLPAAIALALPTVFIPVAVDAYVLPRGAIVIAGAGLGCGLALLLPGASALGRLRLPLLAAAAAALLAFACSISWPLSLEGSYTRYESLPIRLAYLGLLASPVWLLRDRASRELVIPAFVLGTTIASFQALVQAVLLLNHSIDYRPDGNLGNANLLGALLAMAIPLAFSRGLHAPRFGVLWWAALAVLVAALVATTSRSGGLGALAGCLAVIVFMLKGRRAAVGATVAIAIVGIGLAVIVASPLRFLNDDPGPARMHLWADAVRMIAARPLTGWGEDATGLVYGRFLSGAWAPEVDRAHSGPLDVAATQGLIGLVALAWVLFTLARDFWRRRFAGSVGPLAAACVGYTVWVLFNFDWAPATGLFWLLGGTAWSGMTAAEGESAPDQSVRLGSKGLVARATGAVVLAAGVIWLGVMPVLADVWYHQSRLDLSVIVDPLQGRYHWQLGQQLVAAGSTSRGQTQLQLAARLGESDPQLFVDLGDADQRLGRSADAQAAYRMAVIIDPYFKPARDRLAGKGVPPPG